MGIECLCDNLRLLEIGADCGRGGDRAAARENGTVAGEDAGGTRKGLESVGEHTESAR